MDDRVSWFVSPYCLSDLFEKIILTRCSMSKRYLFFRKNGSMGLLGLVRHVRSRTRRLPTIITSVGKEDCRVGRLLVNSRGDFCDRHGQWTGTLTFFTRRGLPSLCRSTPSVRLYLSFPQTVFFCYSSFVLFTISLSSFSRPHPIGR